MNYVRHFRGIVASVGSFLALTCFVLVFTGLGANSFGEVGNKPSKLRVNSPGFVHMFAIGGAKAHHATIKPDLSHVELFDHALNTFVLPETAFGGPFEVEETSPPKDLPGDGNVPSEKLVEQFLMGSHAVTIFGFVTMQDLIDSMPRTS